MSKLPDRVPRLLSAFAVTLFLTACSSDVTAPVLRDPGAPSRDVATTTSTLLIDTGPGANVVGSVVDNFSAFDFQFIGGRITLANETDLESVAGWMKIFLGGSIDVHIRADNGGFPGADLHSQSYTIAAGATFDWTVFSSYNIRLAAGTYWLTFEPVRGGGFFASMPNGAAAPLPSYAWMGPFSGGWSYAFGATPPSMGFRVTGTEVTPATLIDDLESFVAGTTIPSGNAQSINSKLGFALAALDAGQTSTACIYLQDVINYTKAQTGKKISPADASQIIAQVTAIRAKVGC